jgi:hypothetical protein
MIYMRDLLDRNDFSETEKVELLTFAEEEVRWMVDESDASTADIYMTLWALGKIAEAGVELPHQTVDRAVRFAQDNVEAKAFNDTKKPFAQFKEYFVEKYGLSV